MPDRHGKDVHVAVDESRRNRGAGCVDDDAAVDRIEILHWNEVADPVAVDDDAHVLDDLLTREGARCPDDGGSRGSCLESSQYQEDAD